MLSRSSDGLFMIESISGLLLILACGLLGREDLIKEQPSLKTTLHHLDAYRDAIGLGLLITSLCGVYHAVMTACTSAYVPLYWMTWSTSCGVGLLCGIALSFDLIGPTCKQGPAVLYHMLFWLAHRTVNASRTLSWLGMLLGVWRILHVWLS